VERARQWWVALPRTQQALAIAIVFAAVVAASSAIALRRDTTVALFAVRLHPEQVAEVVERLAEWNEPFVSGTDNVRIARSRRSPVLLRLALAGVPHAHVATTGEALARVGPLTPQAVLDAQTLDGLAGDLALGLRGISGVEDARVIIAPARPALFASDPSYGATASVRLRLHAGTQLEPDAVSGIRAFVAAGVPSLDPARVTLIDDRGLALGDPARAGPDDAPALQASLQSALDQALASREQAERRLTVLGLTPGDFAQQVSVRSPLSGKVLELSVVPGEFRNDTSAPVMTIADLSTVWVSSQVPETYIRFIQPGERVDIKLVAYPDETFEGRVSRIADTVDAQTRTVKVHAEMVNPQGRFRPEMFGSIHHIESMEKMAVVPAGAVLENNGRSMVFVESSPGTFQERVVTIGKKDGDRIRILKGLKPGEIVVADGAMLLNDLIKKPA